MTPDSRSYCVVVGYDGSPASRAALARAADRAGAEGKLYVVHAYAPPGDWIGRPPYQQLLDVQLNSAEDLMGRLEEEQGADLQGVSWESEVIGDSPARVDRSPSGLARMSTASPAPGTACLRTSLPIGSSIASAAKPRSAPMITLRGLRPEQEPIRIGTRRAAKRSAMRRPVFHCHTGQGQGCAVLV
jgi:hypothetical protein